MEVAAAIENFTISIKAKALKDTQFTDGDHTFGSIKEALETEYGCDYSTIKEECVDYSTIKEECVGHVLKRLIV